MSQFLPHGHIDQTALGRKNDYLYRVSLKDLIINQHSEVLVVKEAGRTWWDLPGGGMDHNEDIQTALARELKEEIGLTGKFDYRIIDFDEPAYLPNANVFQIRLIFHVIPKAMQFQTGIDTDEIVFQPITLLEASDNPVENRISRYASHIISAKQG